MFFRVVSHAVSQFSVALSQLQGGLSLELNLRIPLFVGPYEQPKFLPALLLRAALVVQVCERFTRVVWRRDGVVGSHRGNEQ